DGEHLEVNQPRERRNSRGRYHHFDDQDTAARGHGITTVAQDRLASRVVPVVEDVLEYIRVAASGDRREKVTAQDLAACAQPDAPQQFPRPLGDVRQVEDDASHVRIRVQDLREKEIVAPANVGNLGQAREIIRFRYGVGG